MSTLVRRRVHGREMVARDGDLGLDVSLQEVELLLSRRVPVPVHERGLGRVVVGHPLTEMVGDIEPAGVVTRILEIDHDELVRGVECLEDVSVLCLFLQKRKDEEQKDRVQS